MASAGSLEDDFKNPPRDARLRAYWWWLNGNVDQAAITRDLEQMKQQGFGGALICDAGGADQWGNRPVPAGPAFMSPAWRTLYRHTLREADRLGLELSLAIQSGWNLGGPLVDDEHATKSLCWSRLDSAGPRDLAIDLPMPAHRGGFYRDIGVVAVPLKSEPSTRPARKPIRLLDAKIAANEFGMSAPDCTPLLEDEPAPAPADGDVDCAAADVLDISRHMNAAGRLQWTVPPGKWLILRFGYGVTGAHVSTSSDGWKGAVIDYMDPDAFRFYWDRVVEPLIADAGPLAGKTLRYLHTDSWELGGINWSPRFREEFRSRRGYDPLPWLPVAAGQIIGSRQLSNRFLVDFRRTIGDCIAENHYRLMSKMAAEHGLGIHPESGGPHGAPIDSLECLGICDVPMSEFWARSWMHRTKDEERMFVKQPASAAHTYGRRIVAAEGMTTIGPHWQETLWDNLKPSFDQAACDGVNLLFWHAFTCSPSAMGLPGQEYFAGTHFNPNSTWWSKSGPFLAYINRCQAMLQRGLFVADVCYYYGDTVPNFAQLKASDPAGARPGHDYDVATEQVLLQRMSVKDGRIVLPDGMSYRVLVLPKRTAISLPALRKIRELIEAGATVIGAPPQYASGLRDYPRCDEEVRQIAAALWGEMKDQPRDIGAGRLYPARPAREVLRELGVAADFECLTPKAPVDYIHRRDGGADLYFIANRSKDVVRADFAFRVAGRQPEIWDAVEGSMRDATTWRVQDPRTIVPLELPPYGSTFIIFRKPAAPPADARTANWLELTEAAQLPGPWEVCFDPAWGGPQSVQFPQLVSWTKHEQAGIRFYSGSATYRIGFDVPADQWKPGRRWMIDLGEARIVATVRLNGADLGSTWAMPMRVEATRSIKAAGNVLEVAVTNTWANRVIGDAALPVSERRTNTNVGRLTKETALFESGLLGPVRLLWVKEP